MVIITYFTFYSMLFLEDKTKIQELCANSQSTMADDINFFCVLGPGKYSKKLQSEETTAFRHGN
jgi:hypothetical protein